MRCGRSARSATVRYDRIAYWKREEMFGICLYLGCRVGLTDGRVGSALNEVTKQGISRVGIAEGVGRVDPPVHVYRRSFLSEKSA